MENRSQWQPSGCTIWPGNHGRRDGSPSLRAGRERFLQQREYPRRLPCHSWLQARPSLSCLSPKDIVPQPLGTRDPPQSGSPEILPHFLASSALHQNEPLETMSVQLNFLSSLFLVGITTRDAQRHLGYQPGDQCAQRVRKGPVFSKAGFRDGGMEGQVGRDCAQGLRFLCQTRRDEQQMLVYLWSQGQDDLDPSRWELGPRSCRGK